MASGSGNLASEFKDLQIFERHQMASRRISSWRVFLENMISGISDPIFTKFTTQLLWDVTGSDTCVLIFVGKSYFVETLAEIKSDMVVSI